MSRLRLLLLISTVSLAIAGAGGCAKREAEPLAARCACEGADAAPPVDTVLMAYLSKARSLHHEADLREQQEDLRGAVAALERLVETPVPGASAALEEAREVLADARARLADLRGQLGEFERAERDVDEGLSRAPKESYFEGHLYEVRGVNAERRAKALSERGERREADSARREAMKAFEQAVAIQDKVIHKALRDGGGAR
jgi:tetratricopeptide (TPR) repeat protein